MFFRNAVVWDENETEPEKVTHRPSSIRMYCNLKNITSGHDDRIYIGSIEMFY